LRKGETAMRARRKMKKASTFNILSSGKAVFAAALFTICVFSVTNVRASDLQVDTQCKLLCDEITSREYNYCLQQPKNEKCIIIIKDCFYSCKRYFDGFTKSTE
jgi:hypothetical protein